MNLFGRHFRCYTIPQFKIQKWLEAQGVKPEDILYVDLLSRDSLKITSPFGAYMILKYVDGEVVIDQTPE